MQLRIDHQHIVTGGREQRTGVAIFERKMRLPAPEIDAAVERPGRVDEGKLHEATRSPTTPRAAAVPNCSSQAVSRPTPSITLVRGRQPVAAVNLVVSDT